jgi:hypothetical protein
VSNFSSLQGIWAVNICKIVGLSSLVNPVHSWRDQALSFPSQPRLFETQRKGVSGPRRGRNPGSRRQSWHYTDPACRICNSHSDDMIMMIKMMIS